MSNYIIYCRKSSESEERQVLSIESQIKELKTLAQKLDLPISEVLTESRSAKYPGRPVFNLLMNMIARGEIKGVVSWKLDRLARNPIDGAALVWALDQGKIEGIITPSNNLRNNSNDKFMMQIEFGMAKKYVDDLSDNVRRGIRMKLDKGWLPGRPPIGYLNEPRERTIVIDPDRFTLVRKMWDLLLQGISPIQVHRIAAKEWGLKTVIHKKYGGGPLSLSGVYRTFTNPFYYGVIERKEGMFNGNHEPMITQDEFCRAQSILGRKGKPRPKTRRFAFTGLIRCGECGGAITAEEKVNRFGSHYVYYHCTKKNRAAHCSQRVIRQEELERQILEYLEKVYIPTSLLEAALSYLTTEAEDDEQKEIDYEASNQKAFKDCERRLETLNQMRLRDLIDDAEYLKEKRLLLDEKMRLERGVHGIHGAKRARELTAKTFAFAHEAKEMFLKGSLEAKRGILHGIGSNLILRDKKLTVQAEKPFLLIEKSKQDSLGEISWIEPTRNEAIPTLMDRSSPSFLLWCTLVHDVRTFYEEKLRRGKLKEAEETHLARAA